MNDPGRVSASPLTRGEGSFTPSSLLPVPTQREGRRIVQRNLAGYEVQAMSPMWAQIWASMCGANGARMRRISGHHVG